jgi:tRNA threonylcarbamoyl adenosine modification protein YeaZ
VSASRELLLAIDTAGSDAGLVLVGGGRTSTYFLETGAAGAARTEDLAGGATRLLAARGLAPSDLTAVAAVVGPGSYTGLRSGLAFLRGLSFADSLPAVAIGALELLAWRGGNPGESVVAVGDAGSGRYAAAVYSREETEVCETVAPRIVEADAFGDFLRSEGQGSVVVLAVSASAHPAFARIEEAAKACGNALRTAGGNSLEALAVLAERRCTSDRVTPVASLLPIYVGQPAAKPNRHRVAVQESDK